jgi:hypothetical protein
MPLILQNVSAFTDSFTLSASSIVIVVGIPDNVILGGVLESGHMLLLSAAFQSRKVGNRIYNAPVHTFVGYGNPAPKVGNCTKSQLKQGNWETFFRVGRPRCLESRS